MNGKNVL
jgi:lectin, mannose-binding 2